jgi:glutathione peroxidase
MIQLTLLFSLMFTTPSSIHDFKVRTIDGKEFNFSELKGKMILVVNTASECGFTPQYEGLEKLYEQYKNKLVIIGFPANNFGQQEPGSNQEIAQFCNSTYKVTFPMMEKISVKGSDIDPLFKWLTEQPNPDFTGDIKWNFEKFLIDGNGKLVRRFRSKVEPMSTEIQDALKIK